jgi:hypothetical protein
MLSTLAIIAAMLAVGAPAASGAISPTTPWALVNTPYLFGNNSLDGLYSISCPSVRLCVTVGYENATRGGADGPKPLAEIWRGKTTWSVSYPRNPDAKGGSELTSISCGTPTYCMAMGFYPVDALVSAQSSFAEVWNGLSWSAPTTLPSSIESVSCVSKECLAVGNVPEGQATPPEQEDVADLWNGQTWTLSTLGNVGHSGGLNAVWCLSLEQCLAVGGTNPGYSTVQLDADYFNGTWSDVPPTSFGGYTWFNGVDCDGAPPVTCMAVGQSGDPVADVFDTSNETWTTTAPVTYSGSGPNEQSFSDVSCPNATLCVAVGAAETANGSPGGAGPLAEAWDGSSWTLMDTTAINGGRSSVPPGNPLTSVACPSSSFCFAVGSKRALTGQVPDVVSWGTVP